MTELTDALYEFITTHSMADLWNDPKYEKAKGYAEAREELLKSQLDVRQCKLLDDLLGEVELAHFYEQEHIFQATLALSRELSRLVRS